MIIEPNRINRLHKAFANGKLPEVIVVHHGDHGAVAGLRHAHGCPFIINRLRVAWRTLKRGVRAPCDRLVPAATAMLHYWRALKLALVSQAYVWASR